MKLIRSILILLCGVMIGTLIQSSHGQNNSWQTAAQKWEYTASVWEASRLGRDGIQHPEVCKSMKCLEVWRRFNNEAGSLENLLRRKNQAVQDLNYRSPSVYLNMQNSPGGIQSTGTFTIGDRNMVNTTTLEVKEGKHLTAQEWADLVKSDPVLQFFERVESAAPLRPEWSQNYALAFYLAYGEEARKYIRERHGVSSYEMKLK